MTAGKTVLVTGANRGIGRALVEEALKRGAKRVYLGTRQPLTHPDERVTPLTLDVTDSEQIQQAVKQVGELDILINNAGIVAFDDLSDRAVLDQMFAVNFFGVYDMVHAFLPLLVSSGGAIVNNISVNAFAPFPLVASYSVSKAAAFNLTQSLRTLLAGRGVSVHAVRRPSRRACSTAWRRARRRSSPTTCPRRWRRAGGAARARRWSRTTPRSRNSSWPHSRPDGPSTPQVDLCRRWHRSTCGLSRAGGSCRT